MVGKLKQKLTKTREGWLGKVTAVVKSQPDIDEDFFDSLEEVLISGDLGVNFVMELMDNVRDTVEELGIRKSENILRILKTGMLRSLKEDFQNTRDEVVHEKNPFVIMVVGVNGTGKTTTIGKLAALLKRDHEKVLLAAADTFRAAASEQLEIWADRAHVDIIRNQPGADPASVAFDALQAAVSRGVATLIVDTAGRLHTKTNLMEELKKIRRVLGKLVPDAPHETLLILDATTGQNGLNQAKQFTDAVGVTGIVLTKLDGTAKGGIVFSITKELGIPVKYIGVGEKIGDLEVFDPEEFVEALFQ
ncbi:MAG: signal recognition particle-docking protein FtsY [Calditrichaeota bacterium]|nr:signal recognition particle-docking protein FtsY [Calditrichota bacterium]